MTAPHPALAMIEHGSSQLDTARTDGITKAYDGLSVLMALVDAGKIPGRFLTALGEWSENVAASVDNGEPIPALGSSTGVSDIKPEHRALIRAVENGTLELDSRTGLPKATEPDDSKLDDALKRIEKAQGRTVTVSDLKMRLDGIVEDIGANKGDGKVMDLVDLIAEAAKVTRKNGESDQDYANRVATTVVNHRGWADAGVQVDQLIKNELGRKRRDDESFIDFVKEGLEHSTDSGSGVGGFRFGRGSRG